MNRYRIRGTILDWILGILGDVCDDVPWNETVVSLTTWAERTQWNLSRCLNAPRMKEKLQELCVIWKHVSMRDARVTPVLLALERHNRLCSKRAKSLPTNIKTCCFHFKTVHTDRALCVFKPGAAWKAASESSLSESPCHYCHHHHHQHRHDLGVVWIDYPPPTGQLNIAKLKRLHLVCDESVKDLDCK